MRRGFRFAAWISGIIILWVFLLILNRSQRLRCFKGALPTLSATQSNPSLSIVAQLLPATATDIRYFVRPIGRVVYADFTVSKQDFLDWAATQEWSPLPIQSTRYLEASPLNDTLVSVDSGFYYEEKHARDTGPAVLSSELRVVFDLDTSRCHYRFTD